MKIIKRITCFLLSISISFACLFVSVGCTPKQTTLTISDEQATINLFETKQLSVTTDYTGHIVWENSDETVVYMTASGTLVNILALRAGTTIITATAGEKSVSCIVVVQPSTDTLQLNLTSSNELLLAPDQTSKITTNVTFGDQPFLLGANTIYELQNASPADCISINQNTGVVTANTSGSAKVVVKAEFHEIFTNEVIVDVVVRETEFVVRANGVNDTNVVLFVESAATDKYLSSRQINHKFYVDGDEVSVDLTNVSSTDENVVKYQDGQIVSVNIGEAYIIFACEYQGKTYNAQLFITVVDQPPETEVILPQRSLLLSNRDVVYYNNVIAISSKQLASPYISRESFDIMNPDNIVWTITKGEGVASVTPSGLVTGLSEGNAVATATWTDEFGDTYSQYCNITVEAAVYKGSHTKTDIEGIVANIYRNSAFRINNVTLTNDAESPLIRLCIIPTTNFYDTNMLIITLIDANDPTNYLNIAVKPDNDEVASGNTSFKRMRLGVRASTFPEYLPDSSEDRFVKDAITFYNAGGGAMGIRYGYAYGIYASFTGAYLRDSKYSQYMISLSFVNNTLYSVDNAVHNTNSKTYVIFNNDMQSLLDALNNEDLDTKGIPKGIYKRYEHPNFAKYNYKRSPELTLENTWNGFSSNKVHISIRGVQYINGANNTQVMIDMLSGEPVTSNIDNCNYVTGLNIF